MGKNSSMLSAEMMNGTSTMMSALPEGMSLFKSITGFLSTAETSRLVDAKTIAAMKQDCLTSVTIGFKTPGCVLHRPRRFPRPSNVRHSCGRGLQDWRGHCQSSKMLCHYATNQSCVLLSRVPLHRAVLQAEGMPTDGTWSMWTYTSSGLRRHAVRAHEPHAHHDVPATTVCVLRSSYEATRLCLGARRSHGIRKSEELSMHAEGDDSGMIAERERERESEEDHSHADAVTIAPLPSDD
eukprot:4452090-Amphidinium_carterae.1